MASTKKPTQPLMITNCQFTNNSAANEHTRAAVEALAAAAKANAEAIEAIAEAMWRGPSGPQVGLKITNEGRDD